MVSRSMYRKRTDCLLKVSWSPLKCCTIVYPFLGLLPYKIYSVRLAAVSDYGLGPYSDEVEIRTLEGCELISGSA